MSLSRALRALLLIACLAVPAQAKIDIQALQKLSPEQLAEKIFFLLSKTYSPTDEEYEAQAFVLDLVLAANEVIWNGEVKFQSDSYGNLLVRVPAIGVFKGRGIPPLAVQSHLDIVAKAVEGVSARQAMREFGGVDVVETDGWYHSRDNLTTLGADNKAGAALALAYLIRQDIDHPELELIFTITEERGLVGANHFGLDLKSRVLINLDNEEEGEFCYGCLGSARIFANGKLKFEKEAKPGLLFNLSFGKLKGGHSGADIALNRLNAAMGMSQLLLELRHEIKGMGVVSVDVAEPADLNVIPSAARAVVSIPDKDIAYFRHVAAEEFGRLWTDQDDETEASIRISGMNQRGDYSVQGETLDQFLEMVAHFGNGPMIFDDKYPDGVRGSSNLGYLRINQKDGASMGFMPRSFTDEDVNEIKTEQMRYLSKMWQSKVTFTQGSGNFPWLEDVDSWLNRKLVSLAPGSRMGLAKGGLEPAPIQRKFPAMLATSFGPTILDAHTTKERMEKASYIRTVHLLDKVVSKLPDCREYLVNY